MTCTIRRAPLGLALALLCTPSIAQAQFSGPWFGPDKALHFGVSAQLAAGGYIIGTGLFHRVQPRLALGAAIALGFGVGKELYDLAGNGTPSWQDLAWDVAGTASGLLVIWALDQWVLTPARSTVIRNAPR